MQRSAELVFLQQNGLIVVVEHIVSQICLQDDFGCM